MRSRNVESLEALVCLGIKKEMAANFWNVWLASKEEARSLGPTYFQDGSWVFTLVL